jgi:hypothetical protein
VTTLGVLDAPVMLEAGALPCTRQRLAFISLRLMTQADANRASTFQLAGTDTSSYNLVANSIAAIEVEEMQLQRVNCHFHPHIRPYPRRRF